MLSRARKGFTLIELIVVIVILGILAALAIPTFSKVIERARKSNLERAAEALGREAVALAAFEDRAVQEKDVVEAYGDIQATGYTLDSTMNPGDPTPVTSFELSRDGYTATVSINGNEVSATVS